MIKRYKKPKRKTAYQLLLEEADAWVKAIILERTGEKCLRAGYPGMECGGPLQGCHILRKGTTYSSIRHDLENVIIMCRNHHIFWAHNNEYDFYKWIEELYPGRIEMLKLTAQAQHRKVDLKELITFLKITYSSLQASVPYSRPIREEDCDAF